MVESEHLLMHPVGLLAMVIVGLSIGPGGTKHLKALVPDESASLKSLACKPHAQTKNGFACWRSWDEMLSYHFHRALSFLAPACRVYKGVKA